MQRYRRRALAMFIVFPLILLLILSPLYVITISSLRENTVQYNVQLLEQGLTELEHEIRQLLRMGGILYADDSIFALTHLHLKSAVPGTQEAYRILKAQNVFSTISTIDLQQTQHCGILFSGGIILHGSRACFSESEYYGPFLLAENCQTFRQWKSSISKPGRLYNLQPMRLCIDGVWDNFLLFSMSLPVNGQWNSVFYAAISMDSALRTLIPADLLDQNTLRLYSKHDLLYENEQLIADAVCISASGKEGTLRADLYIPSSIFARNTTRYGQNVIGACALFAVLGLVLSWLFSVRSTRHLERAITAIDAAADTWNMQGGTDTDSVDFITGFLEQVDARLKSDHLSLAQQEELIRKSLMDSVLWNAASDAVTLEVLRQYYPDFPLPFRLCVILCPGINMADQAVFSRFQLQLVHLVRDLLPETAIMHFADAQLTILQPNEPDEMIQSRYAAISRTILQELAQESAIVIDEACTGIDAVSRSFARIQFHIHAGTGRVVLLHAQRTERRVSYPLCNETAFQQAIVKGEIDKACAMLDKSCELLSETPLANPGEVQQVYYSYRAVLLQIVPIGSPDRLPAAYDNRKTVEDNFHALKACLDTIDALLQEERQENSDKYEQTIREWVDAHLFDPDLSISMATEALSVSGRSLQSAVRHLTGMSFREYVINRRIAKARQLLTQTQLSVSEISEQCGYASVNAFYKSFKKACMVSPNEMRGTPPAHSGE